MPQSSKIKHWKNEKLNKIKHTALNNDFNQNGTEIVLSKSDIARNIRYIYYGNSFQEKFVAQSPNFYEMFCPQKSI